MNGKYHGYRETQGVHLKMVDRVDNLGVDIGTRARIRWLRVDDV